MVLVHSFLYVYQRVVRNMAKVYSGQVQTKMIHWFGHSAAEFSPECSTWRLVQTLESRPQKKAKFSHKIGGENGRLSAGIFWDFQKELPSGVPEPGTWKSSFEMGCPILDYDAP